jgi:protein TonB
LSLKERHRYLAVFISAIAHAIALGALVFLGKEAQAPADATQIHRKKSLLEFVEAPLAILRKATRRAAVPQSTLQPTGQQPGVQPAAQSEGPTKTESVDGTDSSNSSTRQQSISAEARARVQLSYEEELRIALEKMKEYPALAKARHQSGRVVVTFNIKKNGRLSDVALVEPSSFPLLNEAAIETVKRLGSFKAVPDEISSGDLHVTVPIDFRLSQ